MDSRRLRQFALAGVAALATACGGNGTTDDTGTSGDMDAPADTAPDYRCVAAMDVSLDGPVLDPHFENARTQIEVRVRDEGNPDPAWTHPLRIELVRGDAVLSTLGDEADARPGTMVTARWDGRLENAVAPVGTYAVRVTYRCSGGVTPAVRDVPLAVVRTGVTSVTVGDGDGARIGILWHRLNHERRNYWLPENTRPVLARGRGAGASDLTLPDGAPRPLPAVSTDLETPPVDDGGDAASVDYNLPFALRIGTRPDVTLGFGLATGATQQGGGGGDGGVSADGGAGGPGGLPTRVRARLEGADVPLDARLADGTATTYRLTTSPTPALGRYAVPLQVHYEYARTDGTWGEFGTEIVPLRAYGLLGDQTISPVRHDAPYAPWLAVVDAVAGWVDGHETAPEAVAAQIVRHVYADLGLHYDVRNGASFYTSYRSGYGGAQFNLSGFLSRDNGTTVNCSDCASIVSTYTNMVGCDFGYNIITNNFALNYIHAIGTPGFTNDPFGTGRPGGFRYHAVTSPIGVLRIFDATLNEDGDDSPGASPFMELPTDGVDRMFYLTHLSPNAVVVNYADKTSIN
jgi:hypothetical protein